MKLVIWDLDDTLFDTTGQLNDSYEKLNSITPFPEARQVLAVPQVINVLVTVGDPEIQQKKIDILGIRSSFARIIICPNGVEKRKAFFHLAAAYRGKVSKIFAVGNRVDCEIAFGNECGFTTVLMAHGKYKSFKPRSGLEIPWRIIQKLDELVPILVPAFAQAHLL